MAYIKYKELTQYFNFYFAKSGLGQGGVQAAFLLSAARSKRNILSFSRVFSLVLLFMTLTCQPDYFVDSQSALCYNIFHYYGL